MKNEKRVKKRSPVSNKQLTGKKPAVNELLDIMARLRGPSGCPWDREQTEQTLKKYLIEEAYEVLEAIEGRNPEKLKEELGDLLLQIVFLSRIAAEKRQFTFIDVVRSLVRKLIRRHPHIFPSPHLKVSVPPRNGREVRKIWREVKKQEAKDGPKKFLLEGLPLGLPALIRAQRMTERAARVGFDWPRLEGVWAKVREEIRELKHAEIKGRLRGREEELGDVLFSFVNLARHYGLSAEEALRKANRRFAKRFREIETEFRRRGLSWEETSLKEMDRIWNWAKEKKVGEENPG
ncbi:MAG: tetrapyrrole methylase family protein/MazG family protein [Deltaproteobacteria bacterium]|nr:tetrapyrrole methylase family protein/MazG family protein [Deltaproteobacteria bacterium]